MRYFFQGTLKNLGECCPLLQSLTLRGCSAVNLNLSLEHVLTRCSRLETLDIGDTFDTRDAVMRHITLLSRLRTLSVSACEKLTDDGLRVLAGPHAPLLETLDLAHCFRLSDVTAAQILRTQSNLTRLDLTNCLNVTDQTLQLLPTRLTSIVLVGCSRVTNACMGALMRSSATLTTLDLSLCKELSDAALETIAAARCRSLEVCQC